MAGTGRFLLAGAAKGYRGIAIELEPFFHDLIGDCNCEGMTEPLFKRMMRGQSNRTRKLSYINTRICPVCQLEVDKRRQPKGIRTIFTSQAHYYDGNRAYLRSKGINPDITILQGDSRNLSSLLIERGLVSIMSPSYAGSEIPDNRKTLNDTNSSLLKKFGGSYVSKGQIANLPDRPLG